MLGQRQRVGGGVRGPLGLNVPHRVVEGPGTATASVTLLLPDMAPSSVRYAVAE